jgi:HEPN domain.
MNRADLKALTRIRIAEAKTLLDAGHYPGAYYLAGYAVECAVKACIARKVRSGDFPDKQLANQVFTHDLPTLVRSAGLAAALDADRSATPALDINWAIVKDWSFDARYEVGITAARASDLYRACAARNGILPWVRKRW